VLEISYLLAIQWVTSLFTRYNQSYYTVGH